jgi:hypothetical protein
MKKQPMSRSWILAVSMLAPLPCQAAMEQTTHHMTPDYMVSAPEDSDTSQGTYLGCTADEQQCSSLAANNGYANYSASRSFRFPNATKFECWGL